MNVVDGRKDPFESNPWISNLFLQYFNYIMLNACTNHWPNHCHSSKYCCTITPLFYVFIITGKWFCWLKSDGFRRYDNSLSCQILAPWEASVGVRIKVRPSCLGADQDGNTMWHSNTWNRGKVNDLYLTTTGSLYCCFPVQIRLLLLVIEKECVMILP